MLYPVEVGGVVVNHESVLICVGEDMVVSLGVDVGVGTKEVGQEGSVDAWQVWQCGR